MFLSQLGTVEFVECFAGGSEIVNQPCVSSLVLLSHAVHLHLQQKGVGIDGPLVDKEGYPRADIDVYAVRHARHRIACKCHCQCGYKLALEFV